MSLKTLEITLDRNNNSGVVEQVENLVKNRKDLASFWRSIKPPYELKLSLSPLTDANVQHWLKCISKIEGLKYTHTIYEYDRK